MRIASRRPFQLSKISIRQAALSRPFSIAPQLRLREGKEQDPDEIERSKQENLKNGKPRELESNAEESVGADQEKVKDDQEHMKELQKETANKSQEKHPEGQN